MKISEIFYSVQGEGVLVGVPSVFIRTSGCNLRCTWCDTPYTSWNPEGREMPLSEILDEARHYPARHAVVTGGEPMLTEEIVDLTQALALHVTVETAGTVYQPVKCDLMSISPKLSNSTPHDPEAGKWAAQHDRLRYQPAVLRKLMDAYPYQLKFVVSSPEDLSQIESILTATQAARDRVVLMPEGIDQQTLRDRGVWITELCKREGFRYSPRLHIDLYGNRRGT